MRNKNEQKCNHNHNHNHSHSHKGHNHSYHIEGENIKLAFILNFTFAIIEIFGGILTNSSAILSDAIHDFGDSLSLFLAMVFDKKSKKEGNNKYPYGYKRLSVVSAVINIVILAIGTIFVLKEAIERLINPQPVLANGMFILAIIGIIINGLSVFKIKDGNKISEKAVMLHLLEDLLGWIAVLIVSIILLFTDFYILDPILSIIISIIMFRNIYFNIKTIYKIIMQGTPDEINLDEIKQRIVSKENVIIDDIKIWSLDGETNVCTIKLKSNSVDYLSVKHSVKDILKDYNIVDITIEIN